MKTRVGVIFGGITVEHEVSVISGLQALHALDSERYDVVAIYINKDGQWYTGEKLKHIENYKKHDALLADSIPVVLVKDRDGRFVLTRARPSLFCRNLVSEIDVAFPVVHGTNCEDGTLQGYLEAVGVPYAGPDILGSALGMDKVIMKMVLHDSGYPIVNYLWFYSKKWVDEQVAVVARVESEIGYPVIVKPANLGSSIGISKANDRSELENGIELAMSFANKIIVEKAVPNLKEVNCSVLGDWEEAAASVCEEVMGSDKILSYSDKYEQNPSKGMSGTSRKVPADLPESLNKHVQELSKGVFQTLSCAGVSRIDFLIDQNTNQVFVNEINTIPGSLAFYLWEASGKTFGQLCTELINLAFKRQRERNGLMFTTNSNLFALHGGSKGGKLGMKGKL